MQTEKRRPIPSSKEAYPLLLLGVLSAVVIGCDKSNETASESRAKIERAKAEQPRMCRIYKAKICEIVGASSPICLSMEQIDHLLPAEVCKVGTRDIGYSQHRIAEVLKVCNELSEKLCNDIGPQNKSCKYARAKIEKLSPKECLEIMKEYPKAIAELRLREEILNPLTPEKQKLIAEGSSTTFGPKDASVTIVAFSDFQDHFCADGAETTRQIKEKYSDKVRFVFRHFPMSYSKDARLAAQASLAAAAQGKFWEYHDILFKHQDRLKQSDLIKYAKKLKLNIKAFKKALSSKRFEKIVDTDMEIGKSVHVSGVPTTILNGKVLTNPTHFDLVEKEIKKALR